MLTTETPPQGCPQCKYQLNAVTDLEGAARPKVGDLTICIQCAAVLILEPGLTLRVFTKEEMKQITPGTLFDIVKNQTLIHEGHRLRRRANFHKN